MIGIDLLVQCSAWEKAEAAAAWVAAFEDSEQS